MPKKRSPFQTKFEYYALRVVLGALGMLPYRTSLSIGRAFGGLVTRLFPKLKKTALRNLEIAMPGISEEERQRIARGTFESLGRHLGFVSQFRHFEKEDIRRLIKLVGKERFYEANELGRGIIFVTGHFGSWEVFNLLPPAFDEEINILVRRLDNGLVEDYVDSLRTKFGTVTLGKREAPRRLYKLLSEAKTVGILADLNAQTRDGVFVDFFGVPASTTASIAKLALKSNAVILPAFAVWEDDKYAVYLEPPIEYENTGDAERDILDISKKFTNVIERYVRKYPEQWLWVHKRWNTRPKGSPELY
jgi:KDO2-lipid IV(A) lauroyltransferase